MIEVTDGSVSMSGGGKHNLLSLLEFSVSARSHRTSASRRTTRAYRTRLSDQSALLSLVRETVSSTFVAHFIDDSTSMNMPGCVQLSAGGLVPIWLCRSKVNQLTLICFDSNKGNRNRITKLIQVWDTSTESSPHLFLQLHSRLHKRPKIHRSAIKDLMWVMVACGFNPKDFFTPSPLVEGSKLLEATLLEASLHVFMEEKVIVGMNLGAYLSKCVVMWWRIHSGGSIIVFNQISGRVAIFKNSELSLQSAANTLRKVMSFVKNPSDSFLSIETGFADQTSMRGESEQSIYKMSTNSMSPETADLLVSRWIEADNVSSKNSPLLIRKTSMSKSGKIIFQRQIRFSVGVSTPVIRIQTHYVDQNGRIWLVPLSVVPFESPSVTWIGLRNTYQVVVWFLHKLHVMHLTRPDRPDRVTQGPHPGVAVADSNILSSERGDHDLRLKYEAGERLAIGRSTFCAASFYDRQSSLWSDHSFKTRPSNRVGLRKSRPTVALNSAVRFGTFNLRNEPPKSFLL